MPYIDSRFPLTPEAAPTRKVLSGRAAFTLVELLVVIGIIALLVAVLMPALARARRQAQVTECASNLRQLGMALMGYLADNRGRFPQYGPGNRASPGESVLHNNLVYVWGKPVWPYNAAETGERLLDRYTHRLAARCPLETGYRMSLGAAFDGRTFFDIYGSSYVYNAAIFDFTYPTPDAEGWQVRPVLLNIASGQLNDASRLVVGGDWTYHYAQYFTSFRAYTSFAAVQTHSPLKYDCNLLFADGHVIHTEIKTPPNHLETDEYRLTREPMPWPYS